MGGTNTDAVILKKNEVLSSAKVPTTADVTSGITGNSCLFIPGVFFNFWSEVFTITNRKMHTFDLLIVKGDTLR